MREGFPDTLYEILIMVGNEVYAINMVSEFLFNRSVHNKKTAAEKARFPERFERFYSGRFPPPVLSGSGIWGSELALSPLHLSSNELPQQTYFV